MYLKIDLQELDEGIQRYEELIGNLQDCQTQLEAVIMDLCECWMGVHAAMAILRLSSMQHGRGSSLAGIRNQSEGIHRTLETARSGMNQEKNRCDHFPDMAADAYAATDMQYPDMRESGSNLLFIDYDRSSALVDSMDAILDNELSLEGRGPSQMGRWKIMYQGIDGQIRHTTYNLRAEDSSATQNLREQYRKLDNLKQSLTRYHTNLAGLEQEVSEAFLGYDRYQKEIALRAIYQTGGPGQETLVMTDLGFFGDSAEGRTLCSWESILHVLQKETLSQQEQDELIEVLDRIAGLPEQERNAMMQVLGDGCKVQTGAAGQFMEAYYSHLNTLTAEDRSCAEGIYYQLSIELYEFGNVSKAEMRNPAAGEDVDYISGKAEKWLSTEYKMNRLDIMEAHRMMNEFWGEGSGREGLNSKNNNRKMAAILKLTVEEDKNYQQLIALENKISKLSNFTISAFNSVPLLGKALDAIGTWQSGLVGKVYLDSSKFSIMAANSRTQNKAISNLGNITGQTGTYFAGSQAVQSIPKVGAAIGVASDKLAKVLGLGQSGTAHIANVLSGLTVDVAVDTIPNVVDDALEGQSLKQMAANTSLNVLENVGYNILGEGIGALLGDLFELGIKGGSGAAGVGNPVPVEGKGNTGRVIPNNLNEQMAMHRVQSNPSEGASKLPFNMNDSRWPSSEGWVKMQNIVRLNDGTKITIHFDFNEITGAFDDFKFKN